MPNRPCVQARSPFSRLTTFNCKFFINSIFYWNFLLFYYGYMSLDEIMSAGALNASRETINGE